MIPMLVSGIPCCRECGVIWDAVLLEDGFEISHSRAYGHPFSPMSCEERAKYERAWQQSPREEPR